MTAVADDAAADARGAAHRWLITIAVMSGTFMEVLDTTVVNVALPHIAGSLSSTPEEATWALTSYLVANAIVLPMTGWLAAMFGRKRLLLYSVAGFTLSSLLCGIAPSLPFLIFFRVIQGATGGGLQPLSQAIMLEVFPPKERGKAMAVWSLGIVVAPMLGPLLGGWLTDTLSWRWVFYINLPVGLIAAVMVQLFIEDPSYLRRKVESIDWWGVGLLVLGIGSLQVMLDKGQQEDWFASQFIVILAILAAGRAALVARELYAEHPIVDLSVFKDRTYAAGVVQITLIGFVLYGSTVLLPLMMQTLLGYSAFDAGLANLPRGATSFICMPIVGILVARIEPRRMLAVGVVTVATSLFLLSRLNLEAGFPQFVTALIVQGAAMGFLFIPLTMITTDRIPRERMGNATSIFNLLRNIGGSVGIATVTTQLARRAQIHTHEIGAHVTMFGQRAAQRIDGMRDMLVGAGADPATATKQAQGIVYGSVQRQAAMMSYNDAFLIMGCMFLATLVLLPLMRRPSHHDPPAGAH